MRHVRRLRLALLYDGTPASGQRPISLSTFSAALAGEIEPPEKKEAAAPKGFGATPKAKAGG